jgi:hypothetical protein
VLEDESGVTMATAAHADKTMQEENMVVAAAGGSAAAAAGNAAVGEREIIKCLTYIRTPCKVRLYSTKLALRVVIYRSPLEILYSPLELRAGGKVVLYRPPEPRKQACEEESMTSKK